MIMPVGKRASPLEALTKLHSINAGVAQKENPHLVAFELPHDVDVFLNNAPVLTKLPLDNPRYPYRDRDRGQPRRVAQRHREGPRLHPTEYYAPLKELVGDHDDSKEWVFDVMSTIDYCPPGCAAVWKGREFIAVLDCQHIYQPNCTNAEANRIGRTLDEVIGLAFSEYRRLQSIVDSEINPEG